MKGIYLAAFKAYHPGYFVRNLQYTSSNNRHGGRNVHEVVELFLEIIHAN